MIICVCHNINESQIKSAIKSGTSREDFQDSTGCTQNCGSCRAKVETIYKETLANDYSRSTTKNR